MNTLQHIEMLQMELIEVERQLADPNTPSDRATLDEAWTDLTQRIDELCELYWNTIEDTRGCGQCAGCTYCEESAPGYDPADEM
jgi:aconitase A